jgi:exopolysaccharide biosynthesis protein
VHLEADAEMQKYEIESDADSDKISKRSLNLVQRMNTSSCTSVSDASSNPSSGNLEVLGRPKSAQAASEADEPQAAAA